MAEIENPQRRLAQNENMQHIGGGLVQEMGLQPVIGMSTDGLGAEKPVARITPVLPPQRERGVQLGGGAMEVSQAGPVAQVAPTEKYHAPRRLENGNPVAKLVLERVSSTDDLHAETLEEGNTRFTQVTAEILAGMEVEDFVDDGTQMYVNKLDGVPGVLLKRMKVTSEWLPKQGEPPAVQFEALKDEHNMFARHLGTRHLPYAQPVIVNGTNFGELHPDAKPGREYVFVTEAYTDNIMLIWPYDTNISPNNMEELAAIGQTASPELRAEGDSFAAAYHSMQVNELAVPELTAVVMDFDGNHIFVEDTNYPYTFKNGIKDSPLLVDNGIDPDSVTHPRELFNALTTIVPELAAFHGKPWSEVRTAWDPESESASELYDDIALTQGASVAEEVALSLRVLDAFPPDESENGFIRKLREARIATPLDQLPVTTEDTAK